jgi:hypothetical protein
MSSALTTGCISLISTEVCTLFIPTVHHIRHNGVAFHGTDFPTCLCEACVSATVCKGRGRGRGKVVPMLNQVPSHEDAFLT